MMNKTDRKILLIAVAIAIAIDPVCVSTLTIMTLSDADIFNPPLAIWLLNGYSPFAISGFYIGLTKATKPTFFCFVVSIAYIFEWLVLQVLMCDDFPLGFSIMDIFPRTIPNHLLLGFIITVGSCTLANKIKQKKPTQQPA